MPRRRLTRQQRARIARHHNQRHQQADNAHLDDLDDTSTLRSGQVIIRHGPNILIRAENGEAIHCVFRQHLGELVCGDQILWQTSENNTGVIVAVKPRKSTLSRPDYAGQDKPIAANITQLIVVLAPEPAPTGYLLDQYLIAAERIGVKALICLTKADLLTHEKRAQFQASFSHYAALGYPLIQVSSKTRQGTTPLLAHLPNNTSILVGQSGVGKSSLINALSPDMCITEGELSQATGLGRHTTSSAHLYALPSGGELIDSPGVRSFRLGHMDRRTLENGYPELRALIGQCKFSDCRHQDEPGCAVRQALLNGTIHPQRLASFQHMMAAID